MSTGRLLDTGARLQKCYDSICSPKETSSWNKNCWKWNQNDLQLMLLLSWKESIIEASTWPVKHTKAYRAAWCEGERGSSGLRKHAALHAFAGYIINVQQIFVITVFYYSSADANQFVYNQNIFKNPICK